MATPVLVQSEIGCPKGQTHPWSSECDCRQAVSSGPSHSDRVVPSPGGFQPPNSDLAPSPSEHVCNKVQLQTSPIRVSCAGSQCVGRGRPNSLLGKPRHVCLSLEKEIPVPRSLHPHLLWWTKETNVLIAQPLHPLSHAIQIFTDASKEVWGAHLGDFTARGTWSVPESHLHINFLELKAVLLALKRFQHLVQGKIVLVATDNTTVVAYINKEGGMRSGSLCALLWRLLCWCNLR